MFYSKASRRLCLPGKHLGTLCMGIRTGGGQRRAVGSANLLVSWLAFLKSVAVMEQDEEDIYDEDKLAM